MKAIICERYGDPEVARLQEVEKPSPQADQVLVNVFAASINMNNLMFVQGEPKIARLATGLIRPKLKTPGNDFAGRVEAVGENVKKVQPGDAVFGDTSGIKVGAFAEYIAVPETAVSIKPANLSFEETAAAPEAGLVAMQALEDFGKLESGQDVLIVGASGGIGHFAVQLAHYFKAKVTAVCSTRNIDFVQSLGADHIIDYTREDVAASGKQYDLIVATAGLRPISEYKKLLKPTGRYVCTGGDMKQIFQALLLGPLLSRKNGKRLMSMLVKPNKDLDLLRQLIEAGHVKPVIEKVYPLADTAKAIEEYSHGKTRGKMVLSVASD